MRPTVFALILRGNSEMRARLRVPVFRRGGGSESRAIQIQYLLWIQKEFLVEYICCNHFISKLAEMAISDILTYVKVTALE